MIRTMRKHIEFTKSICNQERHISKSIFYNQFKFNHLAILGVYTQSLGVIFNELLVKYHVEP
jgi:hypothetical protein